MQRSKSSGQSVAEWETQNVGSKTIVAGQI